MSTVSTTRHLVLFFSTAGLVAALSVSAPSDAWTEEAPGQMAKKEAAVATASRTLHFPTSQAVGLLYLRGVQAPGSQSGDDQFSFAGSDGDIWPLAGPAIGDVVVPADARLHLTVNPPGQQNLSWLAALQPDDLYSLTPGDSTTDADLQHVVRLTGLKELYLFSDRITDRGMRLIENLKSLERLRLPESATDAGLASVARLPSLTRLEFSNTRISNAGLAHLAKMNSLEKLHLGGERIGDAGLVHIAKLPRLQYLKIWGKNFTGSGFVHLKTLPSLRALESLSRATLRDEALAHLAQIPTLEYLDLFGHAQITDAGVAHLKTMRSLKRLNINCERVTDCALPDIAAIKTLEWLHFPGGKARDAGLAALGTLPDLRELDIGVGFCPDPKVAPHFYSDDGLASLSKLPRLESLSIGGRDVTDAGMAHVAKIKTLKSLAMCGCHVTGSGLAAMASLQSLESLRMESYDLAVCDLSHLNGLTSLKKAELLNIKQDNSGLQIGGLKNLEELHLRLAYKSAMRDEDVVCLAGLTNLRKLVLQPEGVGNKGMACLAGLTSLEDLAVGGPELTDDGLKYLAGMREMRNLSISGAVTDEGLAHLGHMKRLERLYYIGDVTDKGLRYLEPLGSLGVLHIYSKSACSQAAINRLKQHLPSLGSVRVVP